MDKGPYYVECGKCHKFIQQCDQDAHAYTCYIIRLEAFQSKPVVVGEEELHASGIIQDYLADH